VQLHKIHTMAALNLRGLATEDAACLPSPGQPFVSAQPLLLARDMLPHRGGTHAA
jgi:hypothetical protein